jgi:predicted aldo/keto reductase-like oxidoreductase
LPKAVEKNIGIMAMKALGGGGMLGTDIAWGKDRGSKRDRVIPDIISMQEAQHFTYSMPIGSVTFGCISAEQVKENISLAASFTKLSKEEQESLIAKVTDIAKNNTLEHYKTNGISVFKS